MKLYWGLLPFMLGLAACNSKPSQLDTKSSLPTAERIQDEDKQEKISSQFDLEGFSIKDKPTKTIETVRGPREIYDPVKDPIVIAAFEDIYNEGSSAITMKYGQATSLIPQIELLIKARELHSEQLGQYCRNSGDSSCTTFYHNQDYRTSGSKAIKQVNPQWWTTKKSKFIDSFKLSNGYGAEETVKFFSVLPEDVQFCSRKKFIVSSDFKPIGMRSGQPKNEQLNEFFETFCLAE